MKKILGLGNAITDVFAFIENDFLLDKLNISKGSMSLIDDKRILSIKSHLSDENHVMVTGGSASNTISGLAKLGVKTGFSGKIGKDKIGKYYHDELNNHGIKTHMHTSDLLSGQCMVLVSPDGERTMNTFLGASCQLEANDIDIHLFKEYDYFHIEGYLVQNQELIQKATHLAKQNGLKVSIDLASFNVVAENLHFLTELIINYVDIVFANEEEAQALTGFPVEEALLKISSMCDIAIVKVGKEGSHVRSEGKNYKIEAIEADCIDTTGAGDLFASGFLFGLSKGYPLDICGKIGSLTSGNVVEVIGAKMDDDRWNNIKTEINYLLNKELAVSEAELPFVLSKETLN